MDLERVIKGITKIVERAIGPGKDSRGLKDGTKTLTAIDENQDKWVIPEELTQPPTMLSRYRDGNTFTEPISPGRLSENRAQNVPLTKQEISDLTSKD